MKILPVVILAGGMEIHQYPEGLGSFAQSPLSLLEIG